MVTNAPTRLLLVGAGHAHLEVLRRLALEPRQDLHPTLVSPGDRHHYSGMVPGYLQGTYREEEITFSLPELAAAAGAQRLAARAVTVDPRQRIVTLEDGRAVGYDLVSFNVGSRAAGQERREVARHAALIKPISRVVELAAAIGELARQWQGARRAAVVGGGAGGLEVALALAAVLDREGGRREVTLLEAGEAILPGYSVRFRRRAGKLLRRRGIIVATGRRVTSVEAEAVRLEDGTALPSHLAVWLTGADGPPLFQGSGLSLDERGFLRVDDALRSVSDPTIFAAGDCATLARYPETPKAGVYAVRQGPVLWQSLSATLDGGPLPRYTPQKGFLSLLNTADGKALLAWKGLVAHGRWAWWLKNWIDRRFMRRYRSLAR